MTPSQRAAYHSDGFVVIPAVFSGAEIQALREVERSPLIQAALEQEGIHRKTVHLAEITLRHPSFLKLASDPRVLAMITPILGNDIQLQHSKLATKPSVSGIGAFSWHQDLLFYPHTNTSLLSVFIYLDDATPENGCMSMVRGSHHLGPLSHLDAAGYFTGACQDERHWRDYPDRVLPIVAEAGSVSIHHCLTLHGSSVNRSGCSRRGLVFSYRADDALQLADCVFEDTGLVVAGERKGIVRCVDYVCSLPRWRGPKRAYGNAHHQTGAWAEDQNRERGL